MQRGYIKIWRKLEDSGLLQMHGTLALFMVMLMKAVYKPCRVGTAELDRGQLSAGVYQLSEWSGLSTQSVRTSLKHLHNMNIITSKSTNKFTIYAFVNYNEYQYIDTIPNKQLTNNQQTTNKQLTTKEDINTLSIKKETKYTPQIPDELLAEWKVIRKKKKSGDITERVFKGIEREAKLAGITSERAVEVCCEKGWASFDASWYNKIPAKQDSLKRTGDLLTGRIRNEDTITIDMD